MNFDPGMNVYTNGSKHTKNSYSNVVDMTLKMFNEYKHKRAKSKADLTSGQFEYKWFKSPGS